MKIKRIISLALILSLLLALALPAAAASASLKNFKPVNSYYEGQFSDVPSGKWYSNYVGEAYRYGLMKGKSAATFAPEETVTLAETLTMASRIHHIYNGGDGVFKQAPGGDWYKVYVDYAKANGILTKSFSNYNRAATRAEFADILSRAIPPTEYTWLNELPSGIPDVKPGDSYYSSILLLYKAGVLTGKDSAGRFEPNASILRGEAATVMYRIIIPQLRVITDKALDDTVHWLMVEYAMADNQINDTTFIKQAHYGTSATGFIAWDEVVAIREYADYDPDNELNNYDNRTVTYYFKSGELFCVRLDYDYYDHQVNAYYEDGKLLLIQIDEYLYCPAGYAESEYLASLPEYIAPNYEHISNTWKNFVW